MPQRHSATEQLSVAPLLGSRGDGGRGGVAGAPFPLDTPGDAAGVAVEAPWAPCNRPVVVAEVRSRRMGAVAGGGGRMADPRVEAEVGLHP